MSISRKSVLVLGGSGLLGSHLLSGDYLHGYRCFSQGRGIEADVKADLQDMKQVYKMLEHTRPTAIINLVALTNVDLCERYPNEAYQVNVRTLQNVLEASHSLSLKPRLIHISTDQVYDGLGPHREENVSLTNYYAFSKYAAELVATAEKGVVLRTNFFGKSRTSKRKSITDWLHQELSAKRSIQVFEDVLFSPLSMHTLCEVIAATVEESVEGTFNLGAHEGLSKAEFAFRFADFLDLPKTSMSRAKSSDVDFIKTYRPKDMRLNINAIEKSMHINLPTLTEEIERVAREYKK